MNLVAPASPAAIRLGMLNPWYEMDAGVREKVVMLGALAVLTCGLLFWAAFIRRRRRRRHHREYSAPQARLRSGQSSGSSEGHHHRRRRRHHRPRNPTLAETGGLPPIRNQEPRETTL